MKLLRFILIFLIVNGVYGQSFVTGPGTYETSQEGNGFSLLAGASFSYIVSCGIIEFTLIANNISLNKKYIMDFGDGTIIKGDFPESKSVTLIHEYKTPGNYLTEHTYSTIDGITTVRQVRAISSGGIPPTLFSNQTLLQCDNDDNGFANFNLEKVFDKIIDKNNPSFYGDDNYEISFYESIDDINNFNTISTEIPYQNSTSNVQELFIKVMVNNNCFSIMNFSIYAVNATLGDIDYMVVCDSSNSINDDFLGVFNLELKKDNIRTQFSLPTSTSIRFYPTELDAEFESNTIEDNFYVSSSKTIWLRAENENMDCIGIEPISLIVNILPSSSLKKEYQLCLNQLPEKALQINVEPNSEAYEWISEDNTIISTNASVSITKPGNYTLTTKFTQNDVQCTKTEEFLVTAVTIPNLEGIEIIDGTQNNIISVMVTGVSTYEYELIDNTNNSIYRPYQSNNVFENVSPGLYSVNIKDVKNDCGVESGNISVIGFPKFFTPNNDGVNDTWQVIGVSNMFQPNSKVKIYDRFGKLIIELDPLHTGWDGSFNNQALPSDDYWFIVKLQDGRIFKNHFTLKR
ncbi:T9SS type B sorting domain-containing protein [Seonamhaeicola sp. MEBiC1930]|uniref:T9SS type B sorting domain-containing protein n=1 Tax=Seonamhaeicola sp. MEBiC01930 TaxID=2976768 RepID=UPI00324D4EBA